jgi:hemolysin III
MGRAAPDARPRWRGRLHQAAFFASVPAGAALVAAAATPVARLACLVYAASLTAMFGASALLHRRAWPPAARQRLDRLDRCMIYLLIAGTYTPFGLLVLHGAWTVGVLGAVWAGAAAGIALVVRRMDRPGVGVALYLTLGWVSILTLPELLRGLRPAQVGLLLAGGVLYTVGAVVLVRRRPDPDPRVFGYHEVWHALTIAACACRYAVIWLVVAG